MTRAMVVAGSGSALAALTRALTPIEGVEIVRHANAQSDVGPLVRRFAPDLILLDERRPPALALDRIAEVQRAAGDTVVVVLAPWSAGWVPDALRAGVAAVLPVDIGPGALVTVIHEVLARPSKRPSRLEPRDRTACLTRSQPGAAAVWDPAEIAPRGSGEVPPLATRGDPPPE